VVDNGTRVALVHDYLTQGIRGAERVLAALHRLFPQAPIYTLVYDPERMGDGFRQCDVRPSFLQRLPGGVRHYQKLFPLMPRAIESLRLHEYDLVISSSSAWAKSCRPRHDALHVCYCHSPARFLWHWSDQYVATLPHSWWVRAGVRAFLPRLRRWDRAGVSRVNEFVANSRTVQERIRRYYERDSVIIHPPVETDRFQPVDEEGDFFLSLGALNPYKRADLAVQACNQLRVPLIVIGDGPERPRLEALAGPPVQFLGKLSDEEALPYFQRCRAYLMPQEEDFGITPVEAQACGRPVVAYRAGGACETVREDETGVFFDEQTPESMAKAMQRLSRMTFDKQRLREHARQFDVSVFERMFTSFVREQLAASQPERAPLPASLAVSRDTPPC
jgi:glycosyltransferase involved in cell wall biosynthesis